MKGEVARKNTTFKLKDIEFLFVQAVSSATPQTWRNCINHIKKGEEELWQLNVIMEI